MPFTTVYRQGDIVLVRFPFTDLSSSKKRPALLISPDSFNRLNQDLILVAITSHLGEETAGGAGGARFPGGRAAEEIDGQAHEDIYDFRDSSRAPPSNGNRRVVYCRHFLSQSTGPLGREKDLATPTLGQKTQVDTVGERP